MSRIALQVSIRAATAAALAVALAKFLQLEFPIYALIAAVLVTDLSPARTRQLAVPRLGGTIVGAVFGGVLSTLGASYGIGIVLIGVGVFGAIFTTHLLRMKEAAKVAGYVCGVVLLTHSNEPWSYAMYRVLETALGIATGVLVSLVPKLLGSELEQSDRLAELKSPGKARP